MIIPLAMAETVVYFRRDIGICPLDGQAACGFLQNPGLAEISQQKVPVLVYKYIGRLYVSVHDRETFTFFQGQANVDTDPADQIFGDFAPANVFCTGFQLLHQNQQITGWLILQLQNSGVFNPDDMRMVPEPAQDPDLIQIRAQRFFRRYLIAVVWYMLYRRQRGVFRIGQTQPDCLEGIFRTVPIRVEYLPI